MKTRRQAARIVAALEQHPELFQQVQIYMINTRVAAKWRKLPGKPKAVKMALAPSFEDGRAFEGDIIAEVAWDKNADGDASTQTPPTGYQWYVRTDDEDPLGVSGTAMSRREAQEIADDILAEMNVLLT